MLSNITAPCLLNAAGNFGYDYFPHTKGDFRQNKKSWGHVVRSRPIRILWRRLRDYENQ